MTDTPGTAPAPGPDPSTRPVPGPVTVCPWEGMTGALEARLTAAATVAAAAVEDPARRIGLGGPMGAGTTTGGRALAAVTGLPFVDSDELFTQVHGPIPEFFAEHGEAAFRAEEARVIGHVLGRPAPCVLSCGGGAVLHPGTRALAGPDSDVVYLAVGEEEALRRVGGGAGRPVLAGDPAGTWRRILAEREGLYREVADLVLDTTGLTAAEAAWRIVGDAHRPRRSESHP